MVQRIHYDQFELGIDLRKDETIADANRLVDCLNAYVTPGWALKPRPGITAVGTLTAGSKGLMAFNGRLHTFSDTELTHTPLTNGVAVKNNAVPNAAYDFVDDDFASNSGWSLGAGCSISGSMSWSGAQTNESEAYRNVHVKNGVNSAVSFTVSGRSAGEITVYMGDQAGSTISSNTTVNENITMDGATGRIRFVASSTFDGAIDNLTIGSTGSELYNTSFNSSPDGWALGDWTIAGGELRTSSLDTDDACSRDVGLVNGVSYEIEFTVKVYSAGGVYVRLGSNVGTTRTANGTYVQTIVMDDTDQEIDFVVASDGSTMQVANLIVRESTGVGAIQDVLFSDVFNGAIYTAIKYDNNDIKHHYLSGDPDANTGYIITDENCPHSASNLISASKIWATDYDIVRYCGTDAPTDWTTADDAGFLPTGTRAPGSEHAVALGDFQGQLVVFAEDSIQLWSVDPDPTNNAIDRIIGNVGCKYPRSVQAVAGDVYFATEVGFRSIAYQRYTENVEDVDIGTPIDDLVRPELAIVDDVSGPHGVFYAGGGQYWGFVNDQVFVYTFSRTSKVAAWTRYELPITVEYAANFGGTLYLRSGDTVYRVDPEAKNDDGVPYQVTCMMSFQSAQAPGVNKMFHGFDAVIDGEVDVSHRFDPNNPSVESPEITITGDARVGQIMPCGIVTTSIAPVFRNSSGTLNKINAISYLFDKIGAF